MSRLGKNRILNHTIRRNGIIQNVSREEAFKYVHKKLKSIIDKYGPESVAVFGSPKLSNEELYLLQKFARAGLKTNNISSFSNILYGVELNSLDGMIGLTGSTTSMDSITNADIIVVLNSNLSEENLVMELKIKEAQKKGAKLILFSSSEIRLTKYALEETDIQEAISFSGIDDLKYEMLFQFLKNLNSNIVFIYNIDSTSDRSVNDIKAVGNFLLLTGRIGKANNGIILLREFNNSTGLMDMGVNPDYLPGYVKFSEREY